MQPKVGEIWQDKRGNPQVIALIQAGQRLGEFVDAEIGDCGTCRGVGQLDGGPCPDCADAMEACDAWQAAVAGLAEEDRR